MKKLVTVWLIFFGVIILSVGFLAWLCETNQGAKFALERVIRSIPAKVETGSINGTLAGGLEIEGITIKLQSWEITAKRFYVRFSPMHLFGGWVNIREIVVEELSLNDLFPEVRNPYDLRWPHVKGVVSWIKARIKVLSMKNIMYKETGNEKFRIEKLQTQLIWYFDGLNIRSFHAQMRSGIADGSILASFSKPRFLANLFIKPDQSYYGIDGYRVSLKLNAVPRSFEMNGPLTLIGMMQKNEQVKLEATAGFTNKSLYLDKIEFKEMGRPGNISGNVTVDVSSSQRPYALNMNINDIGLLGNKEPIAQLTGILQAKGDVSGYQGSFSMKNVSKSWKEMSLEGRIKGDFREMKVSAIKGRALNGSLNGECHASWLHGFKISGMLEARNLNPALITQDWPGNINANFFAELSFAGPDYPAGKIKANFLKSFVRKKPLMGNVDAHWAKGVFSLSHGELHGNGFDITARGVLQEKLDYSATITDLGGLIPHTSGILSASGWFRWNNHLWGGVAIIDGHAIHAEKLLLDHIAVSARVNERKDESLNIHMKLQNASYGPVNFGSPSIKIGGEVSNHDVLVSLHWPKSSGTLAANGGYRDGKWNGTISRIEGTDAFAGAFNLIKPVTLTIAHDRAIISPMTLSGTSGELIDITANLAFNPVTGNFGIRWDKLNLARVNQLYKGITLEGITSGSFEGHIFNNDRIQMHGSSTSAFSITRGPMTLQGTSVTKLSSDEKGTKALLETEFTNGGRLESHFASHEPMFLRRPESGEVRTTWRDIDVAIIKPWLPRAIDMKGKLSGAIHGRFISGSGFEVSGETKMTGTSFTWNGEGGIVTSSAEHARVDFNWKDQTLRGNLDIRFPSHGTVKGSFSFPLTAHFPVRSIKTGIVAIQASGEIRERGIVSSLFPGFIEESKGQVAFDITRSGTWESPDVRGRIKLIDASAYLPEIGMRIKEVTMDASLIQNRIELTSFMAKSGPGKIQGSATFWLKDFGIATFRAKIEGERFQAIYLPELQVLVNPDLIIEGDTTKFLIKGKILIPEALFRDSGSKSSMRTSDDIIILDAPKKEKRSLKVNADVQTIVSMGNQVRMQVGGLDGRLEGSVNLTGRLPENLLGKGMIKIINGKYNSYGIKLDVTRGNIIFEGRPVDLASIDIMALRTFNPGKLDEVKAGVTATGTLRSPLINLYSDPPMSDTDILSYMVLGRPTRAGAESQQTALLLKSASTVLGVSRSGGIQDQIQQVLGIDTLEVQEGPRSSFTSPRTSLNTASTLDNSLMTVGKYLSPDLYVSYGRSLFGDQYLVLARYNLGKRLELESKTGIETSVDLFYKIEFD